MWTTKNQNKEEQTMLLASMNVTKDNKQVHNEFNEKIRKELNVTENCTNQRTKRTIISTTRKNENETKRNDSFECRKCKEICTKFNERMSKN
jgi:hypothetical protein